MDQIKISLQKARRGYELSAEGETYTILAYTAERYSLFSLEETDAETLAELLRFDEIERAKEQALRYLSLRDHFEAELLAKLRQKGYRRELCEEVLDFLREQGLLDDERVAGAYAKVKLASEGRNKVLYRLRQKGVAGSVAESAIARAGVDEVAVCEELLARKWESLGSPEHMEEALERKLVNFLKNKGFGTSVILKTVKKLKNDSFIR